MKVPSHLVGLYNRTVRRYKKLAVRLQREKDPGGYAYLTILQKLKKLRKKLSDLRLQLKVATISGVLLMGAGLSAQGQTTHPGPFVHQPRHLNPLREAFKFAAVTYPAIADIDKDGDYDLLAADGRFSYSNDIPSGTPLRYFVNIGTNASPVYEEKFGNENPFASIDFMNRHRGLVFADIDEDDDADLFIGLTDSNQSGSIRYYRNDGGIFHEQTTVWDPVAKSGNPFLGIEVSGHQKLAFGNIDGNPGLDAIITGTRLDISGTPHQISYYKNDGEGTFTEATDELVFNPEPSEPILNPALADVDNDGNVDIILGGSYFGLHYYRQVSPGNFVEQTGPYDRLEKTGNPFNDIELPSTQPAFVDFDNDSDLDLLLGEGYNYYYSPNNTIRFYENNGNAVFEERNGLVHPLDGVNVHEDAAPILSDIDSDGDVDAIIGHKYEGYYSEFNNVPYFYESDNGTFTRKIGEDNPFNAVQIAGNIIPALVNLDVDSDLEFVTGTTSGGIRYFDKDGNGVYTEVIGNNPFGQISFGLTSLTSPEFADMDGDGDLDMALGVRSYTEIYYFENTGSVAAPAFEEKTGPENPFDAVIMDPYSFNGFLDLADIDHDGDIDLIAVETEQMRYNSSYLSIYENIGTRTAAEFQRATEQPLSIPTYPMYALESWDPQPHFSDQDLDGDLDLFVGDYFGNVRYVKNENPAVVTTLASGVLSFRVGVDDNTVIDPMLSLDDEDDDLVVMATATIGNYEQGDELQFTAQQNIAGAFDPVTGVLTLTGKATRLEYQNILRTVAYRHVEAEGGRMMPRKNSITAKPVEFRVYDTDLTNPQMASRSVNVVFNEPPVVESITETTRLGSTVTIDLTTLMSDADGNLDLATLRIAEPPSSGADAEIDANHTLIIDYSGINFVGADQLTIEVCDDLGECAQNVVTIEVGSSTAVQVYNAVAPASIGDNRYMRIFNLPERNMVTIFSRWGDKVFEVENYDSNIPGKRFEGKNNSGKALSAGTYFYKIEIPDTPGYTGPKLITGYIALRQ